MLDIPLYNNEREFEKSFAEQAKWLKGWLYIKIPDVIPQKTRDGRYYVPEAHKRPFDGILVTEYGNLVMELKYGNGRLKDHQKDALQKVAHLNGQAMVLRYKPGKGYVIEWADRIEDGFRKSDIITDLDKVLDYIEAMMMY